MTSTQAKIISWPADKQRPFEHICFATLQISSCQASALISFKLDRFDRRNVTLEQDQAGRARATGVGRAPAKQQAASLSVRPANERPILPVQLLGAS